MSELQADVLVVGGGTSGVAAALSAARNGARTILVERDGALGGVATRAGIHVYYHGRSAGVQAEIDAHTNALARSLGGEVRGFHPEARRLAVAELLAAAGCMVVFHALAVDVMLEGRRLHGVVLETPAGRLRVTAAVTVDATGDGAIGALAGVPATQGRAWDGIANCYSFIPRYAREHRLELWSYDAGWVDATSPGDLSRACREGRARVRTVLGDGPLPGLLPVGPQLGIRESRHIVGDYRLSVDDLACDRRFDDVVMRCEGHFDLHAYDYANESLFAQLWICVFGLWKQTIGGDVPYRCFLPKGVDGLLIACRALSQARDASLALRMQRDIQQAGEVAGTAAALCSRANGSPRALPVAALQQRLIAQGVLAPSDLERSSVPWIEFGRPSGAVDGPYLHRLIAALGGEHEGSALWWLQKAGDPARIRLAERLPRASGAQARGIALALALLGSRQGVPELAAAIARRDADTLPGERVPERWIACLVALQWLGDPSAAAVAAQALSGERDSTTILHLLHYLRRVASVMTASARQQAATAVRRLLARPDLGDEYRLWGGINASLRWSVELAAAHVLAQLGSAEVETVFARYQSDARGYVREAARRIGASRAPDARPSGGAREATP